ncbi:YciI family protein [Acidipropionibacterium timonense]|uniref:YciI family protein n=1 Tax=Acidipropionibacterium timonense TaxID=2161818 RepID=UPI0010321234|nr:YciI family protein [Acidipropionibacterium timonense]
MAVFIVETHYDPAHESERLAARPRHLEYLEELKERRHLVNAGPLADGSGAVLLFTVDSREALDADLAQDPYPRDAVQVASVREWKPNFDI